ncbi:TlpA family protein disulfide reductase [Nonomuraea sp. NPDC050663]|uniref:TlpA family protein disulfide reductase n=1 Tax=Nonomuraea sp. NPDC050663 TaxID=3364370 RepID=UPI00378A4F37
MAYLVAAVVLLGLLCLVNLLLTVGLMRRTGRLSAQARRSPAGDGLAVGEAFPREVMRGPGLIGFFAPGCEPCEEILPGFAELARRTDGEVIAVLAAETEQEAAGYAEVLAGAARVVVEPIHGPLQQALDVSAFPTVYVVDAENRVSGTDLDLSFPARA